MKRLSVLLVCGVLALAVQAQPAPWHKWQSKLNGAEVCAQTSPGAGWTYLSGPYKDVNCTRPGEPGR